ncbi:ATP-binding domain-containing protein [Burkholderiaceae bacterium DAT-1]|nr:ATP-binding domain-containing protein [Burkholderiaceae bacterium DAT-1]
MLCYNRALAQNLTGQEAEEDGTPLIAPQTAGRHGPKPEYIELPTFRDEVLCIAEKIRACNVDGTSLRDIAVLAYRNAQVETVVTLLNQAGIPARSGLTAANDANVEEVNVLTLHSSKGLEFSMVAIPGIGELPLASHDANEQARVLYVGMTRAINSLVLTAHQSSGFAEKIKQACR